MKELIFIGDQFYFKSGSVMSSIYEIGEDTYLRSDWGKVSTALRDGEEVHIRPATEKELVSFQSVLIDLL